MQPLNFCTRRLGAVALLTATLGGCQTPATEPEFPSDCISTPEAFKNVFENCLPNRCISPNLYAVIASGTPEQATSVYPKDFYWGWVTGFENLHTFLEWQLRACPQGEAAKSEVTRRILLYVGFGEGSIEKGSPYTLSVMDLSKDKTLFVPTPQGWFEAFQKTFGLQIPLYTQKAVTLNLGQQWQRPTVPVDPIQNFVNITGCSPLAAAQCSDGRDTDPPTGHCSVPYESAADALKQHSPATGTGSTNDCVAVFKSYQASTGRPTNAAEARAMLRYCEDVNPCNTGVGFGYNPAYPKAGGELLSHFTGREYVLRNQPLSSLGAALIGLTPP